jgi:tetratricopeptide (TPR) repeat protein
MAHYTMGVVYDLQGLTKEAIDEFEKSASINDNYAVHLRLGADYARLGNLSNAIDELNRALEYDPDNIQAHYLLALIYNTRRQFDKAALEYEAILNSLSAIEPENLEIYGYLGQLYYSQKKYDEAIKQFEIMLSLDSSNTEVMSLLGSIYLEQDDRKKAIEIFSRAIQFDPKDDISLNSLGYVYAEDGVNLEKAEKLIKRAIELDPENGAYWDSMGWVYYQKGLYKKAIEYLNKAGRFLKDPIVYEHMGDTYYKLNSKEEALKYWKLSLELLPEQAHIIEKLKLLDSLNSL